MEGTRSDIHSRDSCRGTLDQNIEFAVVLKGLRNYILNKFLVQESTSSACPSAYIGLNVDAHCQFSKMTHSLCTPSTFPQLCHAVLCSALRVDSGFRSINLWSLMTLINRINEFID